MSTSFLQIAKDEKMYIVIWLVCTSVGSLAPKISPIQANSGFIAWLHQSFRIVALPAQEYR